MAHMFHPQTHNRLILLRAGMDADALKTVGTIHNSGCRLLNLINDILDAAALRKGTLVVQQGKVNLKNVTGEAARSGGRGRGAGKIVQLGAEG